MNLVAVVPMRAASRTSWRRSSGTGGVFCSHSNRLQKRVNDQPPDGVPQSASILEHMQVYRRQEVMPAFEGAGGKTAAPVPADDLGA